jgi:predicted regulator of Ras-like GTPase activity (Roadblock/LC7/MglB family)
MSMSTLDQKVADLKSITGCVGAFVCRDGASVASSLPPVYDAPRLDRVAASIRKLAAMAEKSGHPEADLVFRYGKANLLVLSLGEGASLVLFCEPSVSVSTIEVFAGVAADDVRDALAAHDAQAAQPPPPPPVAPPPPAAPRPDPAQILEEARQTALALYGSPLGVVKQLLVAEVGPIGNIIFASALDAWLCGGAVDWARASELRDALATEIDDAKSRAKFSNHPVWTQTSR